MYAARRKYVGDTVLTAFIRGVVTQVVNGSDKGWHNEHYYLVQPGRITYYQFEPSLNLKPHWVRQSEIPIEYNASADSNPG